MSGVITILCLVAGMSIGGLIRWRQWRRYRLAECFPVSPLAKIAPPLPGIVTTAANSKPSPAEIHGALHVEGEKRWA